MALAKDLADKLEDSQSSLRKELAGLEKSEVAISIVPNEPALGLENRTAQESCASLESDSGFRGASRVRAELLGVALDRKAGEPLHGCGYVLREGSA